MRRARGSWAAAMLAVFVAACAGGPPPATVPSETHAAPVPTPELANGPERIVARATVGRPPQPSIVAAPRADLVPDHCVDRDLPAPPVTDPAMAVLDRSYALPAAYVPDDLVGGIDGRSERRARCGARAGGRRRRPRGHGDRVGGGGIDHHPRVGVSILCLPGGDLRQLGGAPRVCGCVEQGGATRPLGAPAGHGARPDFTGMERPVRRLGDRVGRGRVDGRTWLGVRLRDELPGRKPGRARASPTSRGITDGSDATRPPPTATAVSTCAGSSSGTWARDAFEHRSAAAAGATAPDGVDALRRVGAGKHRVHCGGHRRDAGRSRDRGQRGSRGAFRRRRARSERPPPPRSSPSSCSASAGDAECCLASSSASSVLPSRSAAWWPLRCRCCWPAARWPASRTARGSSAAMSPPISCPSEQRASTIATVVWGTTIGAASGPNLVAPAGMVAESFGLPPLAGTYLLTLVCVGLAWAIAVHLPAPGAV